MGRTDLPGGDFESLVRGIRRKLMPLPSSTVVLPGHDMSTTIGQEKSRQPLSPQLTAKKNKNLAERTFARFLY